MAWSEISKAPLTKGLKRETPDGLWEKCPKCQSILYKRDSEINQNVCTHCHHHSFISPMNRVSYFLDPNSFIELDQDLQTKDPLQFEDTKKYKKRLELLKKKQLHSEAILCGYGRLNGLKVHTAFFDFRFMGGSMGSVVGEKLSRLFQRAAKDKEPAIVFSSSGGARMQEGVLSLMQMAKTCAALTLMKEQKAPMISVLTNPTTGGVAASFATLGDINIAEPGALIGFAGPRVIQQTIGQSLPLGFQTSEYLLEHGMLDKICPRKELRETIYKILKTLLNLN